MRSEVPDAGTGMMIRLCYGSPGEVYPCPRHTGAGCGLCGGTGYRSVCNRTACHEHGCSMGSCGSTKAEFEAQERRKSKATEAQHHD